jgi:hypothetical protein
MPSSHSPEGLVVAFDDAHAVANAGLLLPATLAHRLGIGAVVDRLVGLDDRPGAHRPGRKVLTLVHALVAGGDCIDDADVLRTRVHRGGAGPPGHGAQHAWDVPARVHLRPRRPARPRRRDDHGRAWAAGAGPGGGP